MNHYIAKLFIGAWAVWSFAACSDSFLDSTPTQSTSTSTVFENTGNMKQAVNGIAHLMRARHTAWALGCNGENRIKTFYNEYASQEFRYNGFAPGWSIIMNGTQYSNTSTHSGYPWAYYYELIFNANTIIAHADEAAGDVKEKDFYKAQALTFRAYSYAKLLELYSFRWQDTKEGTTSGVVLRLDESKKDLPLSTVAECYAQIYKDLDDAIGLYSASGIERQADEVWLPDVHVAYAVYARAALNRQDYKTALEMAKKARSGYPLMSNEDYLAGFCRPTSEWIFGSYGDVSEDTGDKGTFGSQFACNGYYASNTRVGAGEIEKELTDRLPTGDLRMKLFLTADKFPGYDLYDGKNMDFNDGFLQTDELKEKARAYIDSVTPAGLAKAYQYGDYYRLNSQLKFWVFASPGVSYLCHIRSSEMVLIEAEANYFLGDEPAARASLEELNTASKRNPQYTCTASGESLFQEIVDYRELELWGEGFNWYDIKRWNRDVVRKSFAEGGNCHPATATTLPAGGSTWTWSIPEIETDYNGSIK